MPLLSRTTLGLGLSLVLGSGLGAGCFSEPAGGTGGETDPGETGNTASGDETFDPTGDPSGGGCMGCLDAAGGCLAGDLDQACGVLAAACVPCDAESFCDEGQCAPLPACTPDNCDGCCDGDDCLPGMMLGACGADGFQCSECSLGSACNEGSCELPCETTCDGCCDATGDCVPLDAIDAGACGSQGATCQGCADGFTCSEGSCISSACAANCGGCCDGDSCLDGDLNTACGAEGSACEACTLGTSCSGACEADGDALWQVVVLSAETIESNPVGDAWDNFGGLPDPYVTLTFDDVSESTDFDLNTLLPEWDQPILQGVTTQQLLVPGIFELFDDDDLSFDDSMGACNFVLEATEFGIPFQKQCTDDDDNVLWTLHLMIQVLPE